MLKDYWDKNFGWRDYRAVEYGKYEAINPETIRKIFLEVKGTPAADVIVGLVMELELTRQRMQVLTEEIKELQKRPVLRKDLEPQQVEALNRCSASVTAKEYLQALKEVKNEEKL
jgi:hypothetical protein